MRVAIRDYAVVLAIAFGAYCAPAIAADGYPARAIRMMVPFPPGGTTDILARVAGQKITEATGQQVIIDNRPGAGGNIGTEIVAKRPLTVEQAPRALARGCDPVAGCKRRT